MRSALERTPSIRSAQPPLRLLWSPMARGAVTVQQCDDRPRMAPLADVDASLSPAHRMRPAASRPSLRHAQPSLRALRRCTRRDATRRSCSLNQEGEACLRRLDFPMICGGFGTAKMRACPPLLVGLGNPIFSLPGDKLCSSRPRYPEAAL